jgi:dihydropyrimidinase
MHAENGSVIDQIVQKAIAEGKTAPIYHALTRPASTEGEAVHRAIALADMAGAPMYIVHVSTVNGLEEIAAARDKGIHAFGETCPQYLFLSLDDMGKPGFEDAKLVFTPPPREKRHQEKLWAGLKNNTIQVVATDHCPFNFHEQKELGKTDFRKIPNGGPGIEHRLQLLFDGGVNQKRISLNRWVELTATNPAKMFGMFPKKGTIVPGSDADIVIWNPEKELTLSAKTHHMRVDYSLYEGRKVKGNAETVISRGEIIVRDDKFLGKAGRGNYLKRGVYGMAWR